LLSQAQLPGGSGKLGLPARAGVKPGAGHLPRFPEMVETELERHLNAPHGRRSLAGTHHVGAAGGAPCGDLVRIALRVDGERVAEASFEASGCAAARAAASAAAELLEGEHALDAARLTADDVADALGGLGPGAHHGAVLAADAAHRALGAGARDGAVRLAPSPTRTLVAMSGGVDSAVAAHLSREAGDDVVAVTLELWADSHTDGERSCCSPHAVVGARALAHGMGLPHFTLDLRESFRTEVVEDFLAEYGAGRTPNPCVRCNGLVRFDAMLALADSLGAACLATGHYARIARDGDGCLVRAAADPAKDQSYMLARLSTDQLEQLRFPLGEERSKSRVCERAREAGLPVADRRESQDLCFVAGLGGAAFMRRHGGRRLGDRPGEVVDREGRVLGRHDGQHRFTVGQRRGLSVSAPQPLYVLAKDAERNRVVVGPRAALASHRVTVGPAFLHRPGRDVRAARLRYRSAPVPCRVLEDPPAGSHQRLELELERPVEAVAPGQTAALIDEDLVLGWGTIR
jgi:tRNA-uridine 2-sulfurtransferase